MQQVAQPPSITPIQKYPHSPLWCNMLICHFNVCRGIWTGSESSYLLLSFGIVFTVDSIELHYMVRCLLSLCARLYQPYILD